MPYTAAIIIDSRNGLPGSVVALTMMMCLVMLSACSAVPKLYVTSGLSMEITQSAPYVSAVAFAPDGKSVISGGSDGTLRRWDLSGETMKFDGKVGWVAALSYSPDGKNVASISLDGITPVTGISSNSAIRIWNVETGRESKKISGFGGNGGADRRQNVQYLPDGKHILYTGPAKAAVYEIETARKASNEFNSKSVYALLSSVISPDGKAILVLEDHVPAKGHHAVALRDLTTGDIIWKSVLGRSIDGLAYTANGRQIVLISQQIVSGSEMATSLMLLDAGTGNIVKEFPGITLGGSWLNNVIDSFTLSPDDRFVLTGDYGGNYRLWEAGTGRMARQLTVKEEGDTTTVLLIRSAGVFSPDSRTAVVASRASTRLVDVLTGKEIVTMISFEDGEWLMITPEGYYNASEKGAQYLNVIAGDTKYEVERFYDVFYRPDIVAAKLRGDDISGLVTITMKDAINTPPPVVEFTSNDTNNQKAKICYQAKSVGGGIGEIRLFHNGKLVESDGYYREAVKGEAPTSLAMTSQAIYADMRSVTIKGSAEKASAATTAKGDTFSDCKEIDTVSGENEVSLTAFNHDNTIQGAMKSLKFTSKAPAAEPHLYVLSVGINEYQDSSITLKYAAKDARDLEETLRKQAATIYQPQNIHYQLLQDDAATKAGITAKIAELAGAIKPGDSFILFVAGHGVLVQDQYYLLTHDFAGSLDPAAMLSSNEIVEISKRIKSLSQLLIFDTCHAGGVDTIVSGLYDARMSVLAKKMGLHIYASASSLEEAQDGYRGNGLFTHTLLDGLSNPAADANRDRAVSLVELGGYAREATTTISRQNRREQTPLIISFGKDNQVYQLQ